MADDRIARALTRGLAPEPGELVALDVDAEALSDALRSLLGSAGVSVIVPDEDPVDMAVVELDTLEGPLVPARVAAMLDHVSPGGRLALVVRAGTGGRAAEAFAERWRPCLDLARAHGELVDGAAVVVGRRRPALAAGERKRLRGLGHGLDPTVLIGRGGLTEDVVGAARAAVERHGLVKVKLTPQATLDKDDAARALALATGAMLVQRVGKTALLYRPDVPLDPPTRRNKRR